MYDSQAMCKPGFIIKKVVAFMHYPYDAFASIMNWLKLVMLQTGNASNRVISALHILAHRMISAGPGRPTNPNESNLVALFCKKIQHTQ